MTGIVTHACQSRPHSAGCGVRASPRASELTSPPCGRGGLSRVQEEAKSRQQLLSQNDRLLQSLRVELKVYAKLDEEHRRPRGTGRAARGASRPGAAAWGLWAGRSFRNAAVTPRLASWAEGHASQRAPRAHSSSAAARNAEGRGLGGSGQPRPGFSLPRSRAVGPSAGRLAPLGLVLPPSNMCPNVCSVES